MKKENDILYLSDKEIKNIINNMFVHVLGNDFGQEMDEDTSNQYVTSISSVMDFEDECDNVCNSELEPITYDKPTIDINELFVHMLEEGIANINKLSKEEYAHLCDGVKILADTLLEELHQEEECVCKDEEICGVEMCDGVSPSVYELEHDLGELDMSYNELSDFTQACMVRIEYLEQKVSSYENDIKYLHNYNDEIIAENILLSNSNSELTDKLLKIHQVLR